jgi:hypothetical protein
MPDIGPFNADRVLKVYSDDINVRGDIDGGSFVFLVSTGGSIIVEGKIDNNSQATLKAAGSVMIGTEGGEGDRKIDNNSSVEVAAGGDIVLGGKIDNNSNADFRSHGGISTAKIDGTSIVRLLADGNISVTDKIDGTSRVDLVSNRGSVKIHGKIDGESKVSLTGKRVGEIASAYHGQLLEPLGDISPARIARALPLVVCW